MWSPNRREVLYLLLLFVVAYIIRGIPSWFNWGWGNDFGIYYGLSQSLVDDPQLFRPYTGWGQTYHYFPMLYILIAGLHGITGIDVDILLRVVSPILGSFSVVLFYFVVKRLKAGEYIPLLASLLLALNPFHAYQTAHAAPLTIGHLFLVLSLLLFLRKDDTDKPWATQALYLSSLLLIMSHHLTTFVYIVIIIGITLFRGLNSNKRPASYRSDLTYILFLTVMTFSYWALIATPVFYSFMSGGLYLSPYVLVFIFYLLLGLMVVFLEMKYRYGYQYKPRLFSKKIEIILTFVVLLILSSIVLLLSYMDLVLGFSFLPVSMLLLLPTLIIYSIAIIALNRVDFEPFGPEVKGIFYPIIGIFLFSLFTWNTVLLPFRFLEYIAYPICILSALGINWILELKHKISWDTFTLKTKSVAVLFVSIMILSGATTYAVQRATSQFEESISTQVEAGLDYLETNAADNATVASDHRISTLVWQRGFNATYDYAYNLWFSIHWNTSECLDELNGHGTEGVEYGRVDYLIIDNVMVRDGVQSNINETPRIINGTYYEKFNHEPFELVFEARSIEKAPATIWTKDDKNIDIYPYTNTLSIPLPDALNWCRVYKVNWTFINLPESTELLAGYYK